MKRLVVIGSDGVVSLAGLRWLADQDASFIMLDRDGSVLMTTGPVRSSEAKLRRAQALAMQNGTAFRISCELIDRKLAGQQRVAIERLCDEAAAFAIRQFRSELAEVESIDAVRLIEARAARIYWSAWRNLECMFPRKDLPRVPDHWRTFGMRMSSLTGSPHLATNPINAILNYLYAVLEAAAAKLDGFSCSRIRSDNGHRGSAPFQPPESQLMLQAQLNIAILPSPCRNLRVVSPHLDDMIALRQ